MSTAIFKPGPHWHCTNCGGSGIGDIEVQEAISDDAYAGTPLRDIPTYDTQTCPSCGLREDADDLEDLQVRENGFACSECGWLFDQPKYAADCC